MTQSTVVRLNWFRRLLFCTATPKRCNQTILYFDIREPFVKTEQYILKRL